MIDEQWLYEHSPDDDYPDGSIFDISAYARDIREVIYLARLGKWAERYGQRLCVAIEDNVGLVPSGSDIHGARTLAHKALAELPIQVSSSKAPA